MIRLFSLILFLLPAAFAQSDFARHEFTLGAGAIIPASGNITRDFGNGPAFNAEYGFRLIRYLQAEAGYTGTWPNRTTFDKFGSSVDRDHLSFMSYGLRGILPLKDDRVQLSVGGGGGYVWEHFRTPYLVNNNLLQFSGRVSVALDSRKRYYLGAAARHWRDAGRPTQQWFTVTGEFSVQLRR